jgi:dimethylaniline monooxygenase (N-oxide forming)
MVLAQGAIPFPVNDRRVAVVGAGVSGLTAAKCLLEEGLEPVVYEQATRLGGVWNYDEALPDGGGVMYRSLHTNTSKQTLAFSDFPLPATFPDFPHHSQMLEYLQAYADHVGLRPYLNLNTVVEAVAPAAGGRWSVQVRRGSSVSTSMFDAVIICSGRERYPQLLTLPGADTFSGTLLHSSQYKEPETFAGQRVVVAGVGGSGVDVATELSQVADQVVLSTSAGAWFIPRTLRRRPWDHHLTRLADHLPYRVRLYFFQRLLTREYRHLGFTFKELRQRGLPLPPFDLWRARFTPCNAEFLQCLLQGKVQVKPQMVQLAGQRVQFADGSTIDCDAIVCCTGYTLRFPFLPATLVEIRNNRMNLYKHVFPPARPNLAFVGFCSVAGSHLPVAEMQSRWVAQVLSGHQSLPSSKEMEQEIERFQSHPSQESPVPMQVQLRDYTEELAAVLGVYPRMWRHPRTLLSWWFGPFSAAHYRLDGNKR